MNKKPNNNNQENGNQGNQENPAKIKVQTTAYKNTEIGVIPEDWEVVMLEELTDKIGDGIHSTPKYLSDGEYFFVNGNNLTDGKIVIPKETKKVSKDEFLIHRRILNNSTILLSINGTIGNIAFYNNEKIILGKSAAYINLNEKIEKELLYQILQTKFIEKYFNDELTGSTIKNLGLGSIRNTPIPLPPLPEQKAIATVLSDTDSLIQALEKKIAKKQLIKKGAMQKCLNPDFKDLHDDPDLKKSDNQKNQGNQENQINQGSRQWEVKTLGEIAEIKKGQQLNKDTLSQNDLYPVVNGGIEPSGYTNKWNCKPNTITISEGGNSCGFVNFIKTKFWLGGHCYSIQVKENSEYIFQFLKANEKSIMNLRIGSGLPNIQVNSLSVFKILLPSSIQEQTRIAQILSDMDTEIEALEKKLAKYKQIKQGLMQVLLTGKIRLNLDYKGLEDYHD